LGVNPGKSDKNIRKSAKTHTDYADCRLVEKFHWEIDYLANLAEG